MASNAVIPPKYLSEELLAKESQIFEVLVSKIVFETGKHIKEFQ